MLAVGALLAPWRTISELRKENERLVSTISDPLLTGINIGNGTIDIGFEGGPSQLLAGMFVGMFEKYPDAKNYIEVGFSSPIGPITVTVQKSTGKTPHQLRAELMNTLRLIQHSTAPTPDDNGYHEAAYELATTAINGGSHA
jgi:hypothetical protein